MDKKKQKKGVIKRKGCDDNPMEEAAKKKVVSVQHTMTRKPHEEQQAKIVQIQQQKVVESVNIPGSQTVEFTVGPNQQLVQASGHLEGSQGQSFDQTVFLNMKGEPVHLGPNTVIVYEQSANSGNFAFGGNLVMDSSGRIVVAETIYDVKGGAQQEHQFVNATGEVEETEGECFTVQRRGGQQQQQTQHQQQQQQAQQQQPQGQQSTGQEEYEIVQIVDGEQQEQAEQDSTESLSEVAARWLNTKYDFVVRKLQLDYDAGVKLLHSSNGVLRCVYLTTPSMQLAFNSVPQFLCVETGIEFTSAVAGSNEQFRQSLSLILAEDGNGRSVIVSAGISTLGDNVRWLLETFKSCNPAWRQVRCVVADPGQQAESTLRWCFPSAHVCCNVYQAARWAARHATPPASLAPIKAHIEMLRAGQKADASKLRRLGVGSALSRLPRLLEGDNFTNALHKGLEKVVMRFSQLSSSAGLQPEEFVAFFFGVVHDVENGRQTYALSRLQDTVNSKQSPTDTITQYAYFLIHQQTMLAQRALNQQHQNNSKDASAAISKYGTSTQECSCLFSRVFRLPCRHILMLTTELKVKTHIPFEPRWTVHHCLFGCELETITPDQNNSQQQNIADQQIKQQQQQYMSTANQDASGGQVIFCTVSGATGNHTDATQYTTAEVPGQPA